ncbi:MAG: hypothetical protein ABFS45_01990, partial [Pseudomonadota bacterium]
YAASLRIERIRLLLTGLCEWAKTCLNSGLEILCIPVKLDSGSGANWTPDPQSPKQLSERSDAGGLL